MQTSWRVGLTLVVILMCHACGEPAAWTDSAVEVDAGHAVEGDGGSEAVCIPGESRACVCSSGAQGAQVCADDGQRLERCVCGALDGGTSRDAGHDAGELEEPDAGPPPECDLYATGAEFCGQCPGAQGCKRTRLDTDPSGSNLATGPPACLPSGHILEHNYGYVGQCFSNSDCSCGLFCNGGACARYCDPEGAPCPDTIQGDPQHCVTEVRGPGGTTLPVSVPYCQIII